MNAETPIDENTDGEGESEEDKPSNDNNEDGFVPGQLAWDDVSGVELDPTEVTRARGKEVGYIHDKNVWTNMKRSETTRRGINIIGARWIDLNKGDKAHPNYRSRLVGQEFNTYKDLTIFAATPPLEVLRYVTSEAATTNPMQPWEQHHYGKR